jgi:hypothetical protein
MNWKLDFRYIIILRSQDTPVSGIRNFAVDVAILFGPGLIALMVISFIFNID